MLLSATVSTSPRASSRARSSSCDAELDLEEAFVAAAAQGDVAALRLQHERSPEELHLAKIRCDPRDETKHALLESASSTSDCSRLSTLGAAALHAAVWNGHIGVVEYLLAQGQHPDTADHHLMTPMMVTLVRHCLQAHRMIFSGRVPMRRNTVVDCRQEDAMRLQKLVEMISLFLRHGSDVNARNQQGKTALHYATSNDVLEVMTELLAHGGDVNAQDEEGDTPLHGCMSSNEHRVAAVLLAHGAALDIRNGQGKTPLMLAIAMDHVAIVHTMLETMENRREPLHFPGATVSMGHIFLSAVRASAVKITELFLTQFPQLVSFQDEDGETCLHAAIRSGSHAMQQMLFQAQAALKLLQCSTKRGDTCLHYAAQYGSIQEVSLVVHHASQKEKEKEKEGAETPETPEKSADCRLCLEPVNAVNAKGNSALHVLAHTLHSQERQVKATAFVKQGGWIFPHQRCFRSRVRGERHHVAFAPTFRSCLRRLLLELTVSPMTSTAAFLGHSEMQRMPLMAQAVEEEEEEEASDKTSRDSASAVLSFCLAWINCVGLCVLPSGLNVVEVLTVMIDVGHTNEVIPILVELPLDRQHVQGFLAAWQRCAEQVDHFLLQRLHYEAAQALEVL